VAARTTASFIYLAPLKSITDSLFRRVFCAHFGGVDGAVAPFINPQRASSYPDKLVRDLLPERNREIAVIPQILNNEPQGFSALARRLHELGYQEINWNLGCPARQVVKKQRGSGLLPHPDTVCRLLDTVLPELPVRLSIKMRVGLHDEAEAAALLPRLNDYPLSEIIIHPRLGDEFYRGQADPDRFARCMTLTGHRLCYNGDIRTVADYLRLAHRFTGINRWMIGRGLLANPFLGEEIKGRSPAKQDRRWRLMSFHDELFGALQEHVSGPGHLLGRLKQVWIYFIGAFPDNQSQLKKITRAGSVDSYRRAVDTLFLKPPL
jgi:tRNA-dihydrouridine synthase B